MSVTLDLEVNLTL